MKELNSTMHYIKIVQNLIQTDLLNNTILVRQLGPVIL